MDPCVLHIGLPKTGSSALQAYLRRHPKLGTPRRHRYVVIDGAGGVFDAEHSRARGASRPHQYLASTSHLWKREDLEEIGKRLGTLGTHGVLVLSQEDWARRGTGLPRGARPCSEWGFGRRLWHTCARRLNGLILVGGSGGRGKRSSRHRLMFWRGGAMSFCVGGSSLTGGLGTRMSVS